MPKIERNRIRDEAQTAELEAMGWTVVRVWETDVIRNPSAAVSIVLSSLLAH
jgi:G:T-mismatch repair DNA endonuclease (very short patch repair protein)